MDTLQKLIGFKPTQSSIAKILDVNQATIAGRAKRNSTFTDEEIERIENFYGIAGQIRGGSSDCIELPYYPSLFKGHGNETIISVPVSFIPEYNSSWEYNVISNVGDGMAPTILNSDKLIILSTNGLEVIQDNKIYFFEYKNRPHVKRLVNNIDSIIIKSDSDLIQDIEIKDIENLKIGGRVIALLRDFTLA